MDLCVCLNRVELQPAGTGGVRQAAWSSDQTREKQSEREREGMSAEDSPRG